MPSWKKVIVSGSDASVRTLFAANSVTSSIFSGSQYIGTSFTGSLLGTASFAATSSRAITSSFALTSSFINPTGTNVFVQGGNSFGATATIGTNDAQSLALETNGTTKVTIATNGDSTFTGKIGINGVNPTYPLYVKANTNQNFRVVDGGSGTTQISVINDAETAYVPIALGANWMNFTSTGNVGINNISPNQKLDVVGRLKFRSDGSSTAGHWLTGNDGSENVFLGLQGTGSTDPWGVYSGGSWRLTLTNGGLFGIGTTAPGANLQIGYQDATVSEMLRLGVLYSSANVQRGVMSWHDGVGITGKIWTTYDGVSKTKMHFGGLYNSAYDQGNYLTIQGDGNIGVNTTTPSTTLDVNGYISASRIYPYSSNNTYISGDGGGLNVAGTGYFYSSGGGGSYFEGSVRFRGQIINDSATYLTIGGGTSNITYFNGTVGIGTAAPSTALQVNGTVSASAFQLGPVQYAARRYSSTVSNITTGSYTTLFNVYGDALSSAIKVVVRGTTNSVVVDSIIDITANHLDDIVIKSQSGIYTILTIKVLAAGSNTEDFTVQAKINYHEAGQPLTANVDVYPYGNEVIEFNPGFEYSSAVLEHDCLPGFNHNSTGGTAYFNINNKARIETTENSDTTPTLYLEGNKGGSSPYTATLIELKSNIDYRGRGITMSTGDTNARWFAGVPYAGASYQIGYDSSGALPYEQGNSALLIDSSKNVIIGATSAGGKLDIAGTTGTTVYARTNGGDWNTGIRVQTNNADGGYFHMTFVSGSQYASLQAGDNSAYRSISLNHIGGNVGVGTIAPVSKLQVDGNIGSDYTISDITNYYRHIKPRGGVYNTQTSTITGAIKITYPVGYTNTMHHIKVRVYEYSTNRSFTINFGGYNYAPTPSWYNCFAYIEGDAATDINHTVRFGYDGSSMVVYIGELATSWSYPQVFIDEVAVGYSGYSSAWSTNSWSVGFEASAFANVTATVSNTKAHVFARNGTYAYYNLGDVAIGSTTPSYKLDVLGTIRATGDVIAYSDARVKNNIQPLTNALQKVLSLRGVTYTRKDTDDKSTKIGVIAQEVLPVLPEVVSKDDHGNYSVSYGNMVGLLIEAIKEQQKEIDELKYLLKDKKNKK